MCLPVVSSVKLVEDESGCLSSRRTDFWYLAQQQQIEALLETSHLQIEDADISATDRIHQFFEEAISRRGSDIHLELEKIQLKVRFRIDGYLQDTALTPISFHPLIFSHIK